MRINLVFLDNRAGLSQDAQIMAQVLAGAGATVTQSNAFRWSRAEKVFIRCFGSALPARHDMNIFLEHVVPDWLPFARFNVLVPNPEWFRPQWLRHLHKFDRVFCKSLDAEERFRTIGAPVEYVGFTSRDRLLTEPPASSEGVLHVAGQSLQKGTEALARVWRRHPDWPPLTIVWRAQAPEQPLPDVSAPNIVLHDGYLPDAEVRALQNRIRVHVCPSEAEGFGHGLVESLSCRAVLITTDAPPMNELVRPGRGLLVAVAESTPQRMGAKHAVNEESLGQRITEALNMRVPERETMGAAARQWFVENDRVFRQRLIEAVAKVLDG